MIFLGFLAFALLVALLIQHRTNSRERQELISSFVNDRTNLERHHRLETQAMRKQLDGVIDRLHTTAADQVAAVVRQMPVPPPPEKPSELPVFNFDEDLSLAESLG